MSDEKNSKNLQGLALWISMALSRKGLSPDHFAVDHLTGSAKRSFYNWSAGRNAPQKSKHPEIEAALGWKSGAIDRILRDEFVTEQDVFLADEDKAARRASELSTDELLTELTRRMKAAEAIAEQHEANVIKIDATLHEGKPESKPADKQNHGTVTPLGTRRRAPQYQAARTEIPSDSPLDDSDE
ncbi:hypothetical protein M707_02465 [Arthrobacter sp. AK-YN10]|nr:hypothetical protein M707_02465 [Arthrobacter sp. AK-YN10]